MDPNVVFASQSVVPNRFALALASAARARALNRGAEPRLACDHAGNVELALKEIGAGAFSPEELMPFLPAPGEAVARLAAPRAAPAGPVTDHGDGR